jgi:signal transduction histidine kinase
MEGIKRHWWATGTGALLLAYALLSMYLGNSQKAYLLGDLSALALMSATAAAMAVNAKRLSGQSRIFWSLMASGFLMWVINQALWTWYEVVLRKPLPDPFVGDVILFLHLVPFMAAVAFRPHRRRDQHKLHFSTLSFLMLLVWWVFLYAFIVFPDEYIATNVDVYGHNFDLLYLVENLLLLAVLGAASARARGGWHRVYWNLFLASALYTLGSESMNAAITRGQYYSGSLYDVPFMAAVSWFLWAALVARGTSENFEPAPVVKRGLQRLAPRLAMIAMLSLPAMGYWTIYFDPSPWPIRKFRILVILVALLALGTFVFLKQYLLDRELIRLLDESNNSFSNLQRLQTQVVQQEKLASLGQLVAGAAHELNNPLTAILGYSELLSANPALHEDERSMVNKIRQQARRTRDLVSDLLRFAQQAPAEKTPLELGVLVQRVVHTQMIKVEARKIEIKFTCEPDLPKLVGNANQLFTACLQIIDNAIDALEGDGGGSLLVTLCREEDLLVIQFSDSGPGVKDAKRVFDPFYTTKPIGKGTGLGLSATYGVVKDHGGQISCYNKPERGAVFVVRLPAMPGLAVAASTRS